MLKKTLKISIVLSIISIVITVFINMLIAKEYLRSDGKTRALFGMKELLQYEYQYYVLIPGVSSLVLAIMSIKKKLPADKKTVAILLSVLAIAIVFIRTWRLFIFSIP